MKNGQIRLQVLIVLARFVMAPQDICTHNNEALTHSSHFTAPLVNHVKGHLCRANSSRKTCHQYLWFSPPCHTSAWSPPPPSSIGTSCNAVHHKQWQFLWGSRKQTEQTTDDHQRDLSKAEERVRLDLHSRGPEVKGCLHLHSSEPETKPYTYS